MADNVNAQLSDLLSREMHSWKSIELRVQSRFTRNDADPKARPPTYDTFESHYIETALGQKRMETKQFLGGVLRRRSEAYLDGKKGADVVFGGAGFLKIVQAEVRREFPRLSASSEQAKAPDPLRNYHLGRDPLYAVLGRAEHLGADRMLDRPCELFYFARVKLGVLVDQAFWLDAETGIPLRIATYLDCEGYKQGHAVSIWKAESFDRVNGHPFVMLSSVDSYSPRDFALTRSTTHEVTSLAFDKEYASTEFVPAFPSGTHVIDAIAQKEIVVESRKPAVSAPSQARISAPVAEVIQAVPPRSWSSDVGAASIALGFAALAAALVLWRRKRASSR